MIPIVVIHAMNMIKIGVKEKKIKHTYFTWFGSVPTSTRTDALILIVVQVEGLM